MLKTAKNFESWEDKGIIYPSHIFEVKSPGDNDARKEMKNGRKKEW